MSGVIRPQRGSKSVVQHVKRPPVALVLLGLITVIGLLVWPARAAIFASDTSRVTGNWSPADLLYTVAFSRADQPSGPLVVYRAPGADLRAAVPVIAVDRSHAALVETPLTFPSPDGRLLALLSPISGSNLDGASLSILSTGGALPASTGTYRANAFIASNTPGTLLITLHAAMNVPVIWSADSSALYYESGTERVTIAGMKGSPSSTQETGVEEIHRITLTGHLNDSVILREAVGNEDLRPVGSDRTGAVILTGARAGQPVVVLRLPAEEPGATPETVMTLPPGILPGDVLGMGSDGDSLLIEHTTTGQRTTRETISMTTHAIQAAAPLFSTARYGSALAPLTRSADGSMLVMSQVVSVRGDLAAQGIAGVPALENLVVVDTRTGARQTLQLPYGGQIVQAFWSSRLAPGQLHAISANALSKLLAFRKRASNGPSQNATPQQQDEWMLEGHANLLFDGPVLPDMCYGLCSSPSGTPHVSAAILHGVAYTESDWHQFNSSDFQIGGEPIGSPIESFDGGWGEYQQTWGMPPQCIAANNCRGDVSRIQHDQSYNIGVGIQSLIHAWNATAGVASGSDPNDPYKANDWFFAVWAYNGSSGNSPADVPPSQYGHWYPGAPFNSIYEERVWYFADHPQNNTTGWTDNYVPSLGPSMLPLQSDFTNTNDSFVYCVTCTIPDWTPGSYDRDWVGYGAPDTTTAGYFAAAFAQLGGENALGLPRDNGGGAPVHAWGRGLAQDYGGGSKEPGALLLADGTTTAYFISGSLWTQYLVVDGGATGCHGYPTSNLNPYTYPGLGSDTYSRQTFQHGYMLWDVTTGTIAADVCL